MKIVKLFKRGRKRERVKEGESEREGENKERGVKILDFIKMGWNLTREMFEFLSFSLHFKILCNQVPPNSKLNDK